jgi:two-component system, OmpR family, response regulator
MKILLLEDDVVLADIYSDFLSEYFDVDTTYSSDIALKMIESTQYDFYIFDVNVVGMTGLALIKELRSFNDQTPVIFITAYKDVQTLKDAFSGGASDFLRKPFELEELLVRIENIKQLRGIDLLITIEEKLFFDKVNHQILQGEIVKTISHKESELLAYLYSHRDRVVSLDELLQNLWSYENMPSTDTIRTYVKTLRQLIGREHIINIRGEGYRFE